MEQVYLLVVSVPPRWFDELYPPENYDEEEVIIGIFTDIDILKEAGISLARDKFPHLQNWKLEARIENDQNRIYINKTDRQGNTTELTWFILYTSPLNILLTREKLLCCDGYY